MPQPFGLRLGQPTQLLGKTNLRVKGQTPRESVFARALTAQPPATRSDHSTGVCRENGARTEERGMRVQSEEVREEKSAGSPGVWWSPGVGANGGACGCRARPRHAPSRDRKLRVQQHITPGFHPIHTRVRSYFWSGGPYSYSTAVITAACIRPIRGRNGVGCRWHRLTAITTQTTCFLAPVRPAHGLSLGNELAVFESEPFLVSLHCCRTAATNWSFDGNRQAKLL